MNVESLLESLQTLGNFGHVISIEESIMLNNGLLILQNENHFRNVFFWGKILCAEKDYYIAFGYIKDALNGRIYYYGTDCVHWGLLPPPNKNGLQLTPLCTTKFQGDPALVIDILIEKDEISLEEKLRAPQVRKLKEEDRLSALIYQITNEVAIIPRGSLFRRADGVVVENLSFEGLTSLESREIASYVHYRPPTQKYNTNLLVRDDYNYSMDFLDPLDIDIPEGCWVLQLVAGDAMVILTSLRWPGLVFYHYLKTPRHGFVYIGHGKSCIDVPFMISPFV